jgi:alkyldihydroxyacetonephosphate synthase
MVTPAGTLHTRETPHTAAGPALRELILGSEGALGAITDVTVRIRPAPGESRYEGWMAASFEAAHEVVRTLAQAGALPDVIRVSDETETRVSFGLAGTSPTKRTLLGAYLGLRRRRGGCLVICGWDGDRESVARRHAIAGPILRRGGAVALGSAPGRAWARGRFDGPYLRDELIDLGYMVETLETAHSWTRLDELYAGVRDAIDAALQAQGTPGIVMCHLSHAYRDGASLYFTFISRSRAGEELEQWRAVKTAACEAIVAAEGTITHHHAVGRDHAPYMGAEVGELGVETLRTLKAKLDPAGIMNPGKLIA